MKLLSALTDYAAGSAHRQLLTRAAWIAALSLSVKMAALCKDISIARSFGAGEELDAFLVALIVPLFTWSVVAQSFSITFIPGLIAVDQRHGVQAAHALIRAVLGRFIFALVLLCVALAASARWFLPWLAGGFDHEQLVATERLFRVLLWIVPLSGISTFWGAILNASESFTVTALAPAVVPLAILGAVRFFAPQFGVDALAWGAVAGYATEFSLIGTTMLLRGLPVLPAWRRPEQAGLLIQQYFYIMIGSILMSSSTLIDQSMATWLGAGSVSVLNYGYKVVAVLLGTVSLGLSTAVFPHFSRLVASGDSTAIAQTLRGLVRSILLATIPITALLIAFSQPIVQLLFQRGAMTPETIGAIALVQACYLLQVPFYIVGVLGTRLLSALSGNAVMLRTAIVGVILNVVGDLVFLRLFGIAGIALSTSCVYLVSTLLLYRGLQVRLRALAIPGQTGKLQARAA